jgi:D-amino-acid dehydrogenase
MSKVVIIGGGIIGLSSAWFLNKRGYKVTVIDRTDMRSGCSYGNAGYICPSHFVPMATPGIVKQGLKWMLNSASPFYIQPRFDLSLMDWGLKFIRSANKRHIERSAVPLRDIALLSKNLYEQWSNDPSFDFNYSNAGLLEMFQTESNAEHALHTVTTAKELGLEAYLLNKEQTQALEPATELNIAGSIFFKCDAHLDPGKLMTNLLSNLERSGVELLKNDEVVKIENSGTGIKAVITRSGNHIEADSVVLAAGSWSRELANMMHLRLPMVGGRGYSMTLEDSGFQLNHPAILTEGRVAITPLPGNRIRFGGTMEITGMNSAPRYNRVKGIIAAVKDCIPSFSISMPEKQKIWAGFRPCSADGLPYIGRSTRYKNLVVATGHSMLGLSLGAGTGKLVTDIIQESTLSMDIKPFDPERFG